jgi:tRNA(Ser,Leu) C12 N-acetylase TAN1
MRQVLGPDRAAAASLIPPDAVYDFNLLVSRSRGGYPRARREILAILKALGDERPTVSRTLVRGLIGVKTSLAPRDVVRELRALQGTNPLLVQYTCKWLPVDAWGSSDVEAMKEAIHRLRDRIEPTETWRMTLEKRRYTPHHQMELIRILAEPIAAKVDLVHPDKILRVDILGLQAAMSVLTPNDIFSVAPPPRRAR